MPASDCTPCVTPSSGDGPIIVECNKYASVSDIVGVQSVLAPRDNSILFNGTGSKPVCWKDGSKAYRLRLDKLQGDAGINFFNLMGQDSSGYWHKIYPDTSKGAQILVGESGTIGWKPKNAGNHCFPDADIVAGSTEKPILAAWTQCGPFGQTCLVKLPENYIESLIPVADNFDINQHALDLCENATSSDDLNTSELTARKNLSVICVDGAEQIVIDEAATATGGDSYAGLASDTSFVQAAGFGQLAIWSLYEGGAGMITVAAGVVTITMAGSFVFNFTCRAYPVGAGGEVFVKPFYNGAADGFGNAQGFVSTASAAPTIAGAWAKTLAVGNTVEFKGSREAGRSGGIQNPKLTIIKVA